MDELKFELNDLNDVNAYQEYEKEREKNETQRITNENERGSNEQLRENQENERISSELLRQSQEQSRQSAETLRNQREEKRITAENLRSETEDLRKAAEEIRKANENSRISAEQLRTAAEEIRITAEEERTKSENTRKNQEEIRQTNEVSRVNAEQTRVNQENARQQYYQEIQNKVNDGEFNGRGIVNTEKVSSMAGVDTYHINYTDNQNPDIFTVTNGTGSGDMETEVYDTNRNGVVDNSEKLNNQNSDYYLNYKNFTNKPTIPTTTNELTNNSGFINNAVNNLINYYDKGEINDMISNISTLNILVVDELPTSDISTTTIYFMPNGKTGNNVYNEYIYVSNKWELIGTTEIDLSNYYTKSEVDKKVNSKQDSATALFFSVEEEIEEE